VRIIFQDGYLLLVSCSIKYVHLLKCCSVKVIIRTWTTSLSLSWVMETSSFGSSCSLNIIINGNATPKLFFTQPNMWWRQGNDYICQFINGETFFPKILDSCTFNLDPRYFDHVDSLNQVKVFHHSLSHKFSFRSIIKDINELNLNQPKSTFSNSLSFPGPLHFPLLAEVFTVCLTSQPWFSTSVVGILLEFKVVELVHANLIKTKFYSCQTTLLQLLFYSVIPSFCKVG